MLMVCKINEKLVNLLVYFTIKYLLIHWGLINERIIFNWTFYRGAWGRLPDLR